MSLLIALGALAIYATAAYFLREKAPKRDILLAAGAAFVLFGVLLIIELIFDEVGGGKLLGIFLPAIILGMIWSFALAAIGLFFAKEPPVATVEKEPLLEEKPENSFVNFLKTKREEFYDALQDPHEEGEKDASAEDGPFPKTDDKEPAAGGFEDNHRTTYETCGKNYLAEFIQQLKAGIASNMRRIEGKKNEIRENHYADMSRSLYNRGISKARPEVLRETAQNLRQAENQIRIFKKNCRLEPGEPIDYAHRVDTLRLATTLLVLGAFEWLFSFYLLQEDIGFQQSIFISFLAMMIISILAIGVGYCWQWTKKNKKTAVRILASSGVGLFLFCYIVGIGYLVGFRGDLVTMDGFFEKVLSGWKEAFGNLLQFVMLLFNTIAFAVTIYHVAHKFNKFHGYDRALKDDQDARSEWMSLQDQIREDVELAISEVDEGCQEDEDEVKMLERDTHIKLSALKKLNQDAVTAYGHIFQIEYQKDIAAYRKANREARSNLYPPPKYFDAIKPIRFEGIAEEICQAELQDIPSDEEIAEAKRNAAHVLTETDGWRKVQPNLQGAYNRHSKEVVEAAKQDRDPEHEAEVLEMISPGAIQTAQAGNGDNKPAENPF